MVDGMHESFSAAFRKGFDVHGRRQRTGEASEGLSTLARQTYSNFDDTSKKVNDAAAPPSPAQGNQAGSSPKQL
jgi:hypothetical protein